MKEATFTIRYDNHCLANGNRRDGHDSFQTNGHGFLVWKHTWFYSAFRQAIEMLKLRNVKPGDINIDPLVDAMTVLHTRRYNMQGRSRRRKHEAIPPGTEVEFRAMVADNVTTSVLESVLDCIGAYIGLTPFGYDMGYGRFSVVNVNVEPSIKNEQTAKTRAGQDCE